MILKQFLDHVLSNLYSIIWIFVVFVEAYFTDFILSVYLEDYCLIFTLPGSYQNIFGQI